MKNIVMTAALLGSLSVQASEYDFDNKYFTASVTNATYDISGFDKPTGLSFAMGIPFKNRSEKTSSAIEFGYANLGESEGSFEGIGMTLSATSLFFVSRINYEIAPKAEVYGKLGFNTLTAKAEATNFNASSEESEMKLMYSFGGQYKISPKVNLGADYTAYASDTTAIALNLSFKL